MHGLVNRAFQSFLRDTYGPSFWETVARLSGIGPEGFEAMVIYDAAVTEAAIVTAGKALRRPRETVLEDFGHYLVSHPNLEPLRRLLRFSGSSYTDFLLGLGDLRDRARLAVPDLDLPDLQVSEVAPDHFTLHCISPLSGAGHVYMGLLRAMADDYGALVFLDHLGLQAGAEVISVQVLAARHTEGRRFDLSPQVA
jgi:hypothetical protein